MVPVWAAWNSPGLACWAPVNAPRSKLKSSDSMSVSGMAAQLTATKARRPRTLAVQEARHEPLAGARLAGQKDGRQTARARGPPQEPANARPHRFDGRTGAEQRVGRAHQ